MNRGDVCEIAAHMAATGAVLTLPTVPPQQHLVGYLQWIDANRLFWFTAFGDSRADGHVLTFDRVESKPVGICFMRGPGTGGFLTAIEEAAVDQEDYRVAWDLWQQVLPARRRFIDALYGDILTQLSSEDASGSGQA